MAGGAEQVAGVVVEPVQDLHVTAVGQTPVGEVRLPGFVREFRLEAAVGAAGPLVGVGDDGAVAGQDPRDRRRRDVGLFLLQVPGDGVRAGVQALLGQVLAELENAVDDRLRRRGR